MVLATDLKARVRAYIAAAGGVGEFSDDTKAALADAKAMFELAPDPFIDTARLPTSVTSLFTLVDYLQTIKSKLEKRDNVVDNKDWDVAKSGELRLYKLFVCNIHALSSFIEDGNPDYTVNTNLFAQAACLHGKANPPVGLSTKGNTMWTKTYEDTQIRTVATMKTLIYLCKPPSIQAAAPVVSEAV